MDERFQLASVLANALYEMHCTGWLHRNISSKSIFFLPTRNSIGLDLGKPYMAGFETARAFSAFGSLKFFWDFEAASIHHPGYLLHKKWVTGEAESGNTGDQLFYMPKHDYYSMGLVLLEIGMWQTLDSIVLQDAMVNSSGQKPDPQNSLGSRLESLTLDVTFSRWDLLDDPDSEKERIERENIRRDYLESARKIVVE